jgi:hypothetical protein
VKVEQSIPKDFASGTWSLSKVLQVCENNQPTYMQQKKPFPGGTMVQRRILKEPMVCYNADLKLCVLLFNHSGFCYTDILGKINKTGCSGYRVNCLSDVR